LYFHKGVEKGFKLEWNATRYMIIGKMFAMQGGDKDGRGLDVLDGMEL